MDTEENNNLVPGFLGSLIGIRPGETRSFPIQFPESFEQESLRGVRAQFTVSVTSKRAHLKILVVQLLSLITSCCACIIPILQDQLVSARGVVPQSSVLITIAVTRIECIV